MKETSIKFNYLKKLFDDVDDDNDDDTKCLFSPLVCVRF